MAVRILVVGGAGYIGSHTVKILNNHGYEAVVFDNLSSGHKEAVPDNKLLIGNLSDKELLSRIMKEEKIEAVLHFAGLIDVAQSMREPIKYLQANFFDSANLILAMVENNIKNIIYSSSAAVYGRPNEIPITEKAPANPLNAYGLSKLLFEKTLEYYDRLKKISYISLRYFNAAGADVQGELGEAHLSETHLIPLAIFTALGKRKMLQLYGSDYKTVDGTCVRDYVHVYDLSEAHVLALDYLFNSKKSDMFNLGSGRGFTNRQVIEVVKQVSGVDFKVNETKRRDGDPPVLTASPEKAIKILNWKPKYSDLVSIVKTAYEWFKNHPKGYAT